MIAVRLEVVRSDDSYGKDKDRQVVCEADMYLITVNNENSERIVPSMWEQDNVYAKQEKIIKGHESVIK